MSWPVLIAHAEGEGDLVAGIAQRIQDAGYDAIYQDSILVGDSFTGKASAALAADCPLVVCGTIKTLGTGLAHRLVNAARHEYKSIRVFVLKMEEGAYVETLSLDSIVGQYWRDPAKADPFPKN